MSNFETNQEGRTCSKCEIWKPKIEFFADGRRMGTAAMCAMCRRCTRDDVKAQREHDPEKFREYERMSKGRRDLDRRKKDRLSQRNSRLKQKFGLTFDELVLLLKKQKHKCGICTKKILASAPGRGSRSVACVDHNHKTKKVRGLLCHDCNTALGLLGDNLRGVNRALLYLRRYET